MIRTTTLEEEEEEEHTGMPYLQLAVSLSTALLCQSCHFTATMVMVDCDTTLLKKVI